MFPDLDSGFDVELQIPGLVFARQQRVRNVGVNPVDPGPVELIRAVDRHDHAFDLPRREHEPAHGEFHSRPFRHDVSALVGHLEKNISLQFRMFPEKQRPGGVVAQRHAGVDRFILHIVGPVQREVHADLGRRGHRRAADE